MMWVRAFVTGFTLALWLPHAALGESRVFRASFTESVAARMTAVQVGNFDGDEEGRTDVAVTTENGDLAFLTNDLNDGRAFFDPGGSISVGAFPAGMVQDDFDEDGVPDLVVSNANSGEIVFLKGLHDSTYFDFPSIPIPVGDSPRGLAADDIDGDHHLDLVVANQGPTEGAPGSVSVLKGDGHGNFTVVIQPDPTPEDPNHTVEALPSDPDTQAVALGNVGGDSELDIVAVNTRSNTMTVFIGNGDLTFGKATSTRIGAMPADLLLVDLDTDGKLDLITADSNDDAVSVFPGNGNGGFGTRRIFRAGTFPNALAMGDFDGDGLLDLAVSNGRSSDVSVLRGEGAGQFAAPRTFVSDAEPRAVAVGNMDSDDHPDVVAVHAEAGTVAILRNDATGALLGVEDVDVEGAPSAVAVADVDNDGLPDLVVANESGTVATLRSRATGGFDAPKLFTVGGRPKGIAAVDLNHDGRIDIAVADNDGGCAVAYGKRDGSFAEVMRTATGALPAGIAAGDFNADGRLDLAVTAIVSPDAPGEVSVLIQQANGSFAAPVHVPVDKAPVGIATGDLTGDGRDDFVVANAGGSTVSIVVSQANGTFRKVQTISPEMLNNGSPDTVAIADFDGDRRPDLAVGLSIAGQGQPTVLVFKGAGDGTFSFVQPGVQGWLIITSIVARDFTGDGVVDLGVLNQTDNAVRILCGSGAAAFTPRQTDEVSRRPVYIGAGDFDGDGRYDAVTVNNDSSSNNASVLSNCVGTGDCINISEPSASQCIRADVPVPVRGDGNGDGIRSAADLVALAAEINDGDGEQIEDIAVAAPPRIEPNAGVDANGDGRVDAQDALALAYRIFSGT